MTLHNIFKQRVIQANPSLTACVTICDCLAWSRRKRESNTYMVSLCHREVGYIDIEINDCTAVYHLFCEGQFGILFVPPRASQLICIGQKAMEKYGFLLATLFAIKNIPQFLRCNITT